MKSSAFLATAALLLINAPQSVLSQAPAQDSVSTQVENLYLRVLASKAALREAKECDLDTFRAIVADAAKFLAESNRLLDAARADPSVNFDRAESINRAAREHLDRASQKLLEQGEKCRSKTQEGGGGAGAAPEQFFAPSKGTPAMDALDYLFRWAQIRYGEHSSAAANCDRAGMEKARSQLSTLRNLTRDWLEKVERRKLLGKARQADVDKAKARADATEALYQTAMSRPPMNCPKTGVVVPPDQQQFPDFPEQQQQQEIAPPPPPPPGAQTAPVPPYKTQPPPRPPAGAEPPPPPPPDAQPPSSPPKPMEPQSSPEVVRQLNDLLAKAQAAFATHTQAVVECDSEAMRSQRAKLELYARDARTRGSKARQSSNKQPGNSERYAVASFTTGVEKEIESLWQQALAQQPENCPKTPEQQQEQEQRQEGEGSQEPRQQLQQEVAPPGYGTRFTPPDRQSQRFLYRINYWRRDAGMTALTWDRELADSAEGRGAELAQTGLAHRARTGPRPVGENLLQNRPGQRSIEQMIDVWGNEKRYFVPGVFPNISTTGDWSAAGHYSQMVWGGSQWVGCAVSTGGGYDWTICHFFPVGNKDGKAVLGPRPRNLIPFIRPTLIDPPEL